MYLCFVVLACGSTNFSRFYLMPREVERILDAILLPELIWSPAKYTVGFAEQLLLPSRLAAVASVERFKTGPRTTEDCIALSTGERLIITARAKLPLPEGVDGILRLRSDGTYDWLDHRLLAEVRATAAENGVRFQSDKTAAGWPGVFRYVSQPLDDQHRPISGAKGLRPPQLGALFAIGAHWSLHRHPATIVMPTGTGKTETMLSVLAAHRSGPMIVAVPSKALRRQTARKFLTFGLLRDLGLLPDDVSNPVVGVLTKQPKSEADLAIFDDCNVIVAVIQSLAGGEAKLLGQEIAERCGVLVVDEAHHIGSRTWLDFRTFFATRRVLQFTATPFRADGRLVDGDVIFTYPLRQAQEDGYFKPIRFVPIHELDQQTADDTIAQEACKKLREDLAAGNEHIVMARCSSIDRAEEVLKLYVRHGKEFMPQLIHSEQSDSDQRIARLLDGTSRIAVCVNMLGEGFDLPALKIAALHDPQKSLGPLLQFTGRFTRTAGKHLGDATVVANIADPEVSVALERLYSEDSDWNVLLSEMSSQAAKEHAQLIEFLNASVSLGEVSEDSPNVSHHLLRPTLSTLTYSCSAFTPKKFHEAIPKGLEVTQVWLNEKSHTLFFVTRSVGRVRWTRSKEVVDVAWNLFVLHHDVKRQLLYVASSDKSSNHEGLAKSVGAQGQIAGEQIFRSLGHIGRLVFNNLGVTKHGRRNLSYAMYTGADVRQALSLSEKTGSRKANLSGGGWEKGKQITIGCSYKGRVWSKEAGTIPHFIQWSEGVGEKLVDTKINTADILDNVLIPDEVTSLPEGNILGIEWPLEVLRQAEERIDIRVDGKDTPIYLCDIALVSIDHPGSTVNFTIINTDGNELGRFGLKVGGDNGFVVLRESTTSVFLVMSGNEIPLEAFFSNYPPLIRYVDLAELDGNLILRPQNPRDLTLSTSVFHPWDWSKTDITKESLWKDGAIRKDSVQWTAAQKLIAEGFDLIFDDDGPGEAADLVCVKEEDDSIRLALVHCKFSGGGSAGARVEDVVAVASQGIRSAKWAGKFRELCRHMINRNTGRKAEGERNFILKGNIADIGRLSKSARLKEVKPEILLVQPGVSASKISQDQTMVLAAAASYLKETVGIDISVVCSE